HRVPCRHHRHHHPDGLVHHVERSSGRTVQSQPDDESREGSVVFPRSAGDARLLRSVDRRRGHAYPHHRWLDGDSLYRHKPDGQRLLHVEAAPLLHLHIPVRFYRLVGGDDHHWHFYSRARLAVVLARPDVGPQSPHLRGEPRLARHLRDHIELGQGDLRRDRGG